MRDLGSVRPPIRHRPRRPRRAPSTSGTDRETSPLGSPDSWPPALKAAVDSALDATDARLLLWGPEPLAFCNEACLALLSHPAAGQADSFYAASDNGTAPAIGRRNEAATKRVRSEPRPGGFRFREDGREASDFTVRRTLLRDETGTMLGTMVELLPRDAQKQLREAVATGKKDFRELFDQAPVFLALTGPDLRIDYANQAYSDLVGDRALIGKTVEEALPEAAEQEFLGLLREARESGQARFGKDIAVDLRIHAEGRLERRFVDFIYQPIVTGTEASGLLIVGYDVTDQHADQERARRLEIELDRAAQLTTMGTMATMLAHELNQPLAAIQFYAAGGRRLIESGDTGSELLEQALSAIEASARRGGEVIQRIRAMTAGQIRRESFDLAEAVREAVGLALAGAFRTMKVKCELSSGMRAWADRIQVQQVLLNLVRNACEACEEAEEPELLIAAEPASAHHLVRVSDPGAGIAPEALPSLFEPFKSSKAGGMGVGLWICRTIVEAQGGSIWAERRQEGGTAFCFTLPKV